MKKLCYLLFCFSSLTLANTELVTAAMQRLEHIVIYDGSYQTIAYPNGDVSKFKGVCTDVIIRSYRTLGIDLQQLVHEDMQANFKLYPQIWGLKKPDTNIDHRRVPNLEKFLQRKGETLIISNNPKDYKPGDIVSWRLDNNLPHIGIVSNTKSSSNPNRYKIIHNIGWGPKLDDMLFDYKIVGHFRYPP
ncbi:hypothetical protein MNBD_GAMMA01-1002 [hydrothermal vent metagenome]|uniref:Periplasmic protein n=1 Tax=hydrothermal vent metagenome TaxID=652676 RepID=A0A3B0VPS2_9ZZZZ